jgi:dihydroxyacetone kinase-like predicted kinase
LSVRLAAITVIDAALAAVEAERGVINDLNVYPVPDGDTGTNAPSSRSCSRVTSRVSLP